MSQETQSKPEMQIQIVMMENEKATVSSAAMQSRPPVLATLSKRCTTGEGPNVSPIVAPFVVAGGSRLRSNAFQAAKNSFLPPFE